MGLKLVKALLIAAAAAALAVPSADAGRGLHVGVAEDSSIWADPDTEMTLAQQAGFDTVRLTAQWTTDQTHINALLMGRLQRAAMAATQRGIQPVVSIYNQGGMWTPADPGTQAQFVSFAVSVVRELPWVTTFIIGNEPNSNVYWQPQFDANGGDAAAVAYEQVLAATYDAIKAVRPNVTIVGGALDSRGTDDATSKKQSHSPTAFIRDLGAAYRASGRRAPIMDVFDEHVYADNSTLPPSMPHAGSAIATGDYAKLVATLGKAFDGTAQRGSTLPILYGEFGVESAVPSAKASLYHGTQAAPVVDEQTQARYYAEALKLALCAPNVIGLTMFHVADEADLGGWQSGLFYADGTPKSSLWFVHNAIVAARAGTLANCPDNAAPTVSLQVANGAVIANASDDVGVGAVQLLVDDKVVGTDYRAPYSFAWRPRKKHGYVVEVRAVDAAGNFGASVAAVGRKTSGRFAWRAPKSGQVTFRAAGASRRFVAKAGTVYKLSVSSLPLSWKG
jgi:Bacterial Ig domain/Cellulase (glycosyl hydrolase family 5)